MKEECFIVKDTIDNIPVLLEDEKQLKEYFELCINKEFLVSYEKPIETEIYYNINGDLIHGDFSSVDEEE